LVTDNLFLTTARIADASADQHTSSDTDSR